MCHSVVTRYQLRLTRGCCIFQSSDVAAIFKASHIIITASKALQTNWVRMNEDSWRFNRPLFTCFKYHFSREQIYR
jgi:hypothetical protein